MTDDGGNSVVWKQARQFSSLPLKLDNKAAAALTPVLYQILCSSGAKDF